MCATEAGPFHSACVQLPGCVARGERVACFVLILGNAGPVFFSFLHGLVSVALDGSLFMQRC